MQSFLLHRTHFPDRSVDSFPSYVCIDVDERSMFTQKIRVYDKFMFYVISNSALFVHIILYNVYLYVQPILLFYCRKLCL